MLSVVRLTAAFLCFISCFNANSRDLFKSMNVSKQITKAAEIKRAQQTEVMTGVKASTPGEPLHDALLVVEPKAALAVGSNKVVRLPENAPLTVSKVVSAQSVEQRQAVAQNLQDDIHDIDEKIQELLAVQPKTNEVLANIDALNDTLTAKRQALNVAIGESGAVSSAAAESYLNASNPYFLMCRETIWARRDPSKWSEVFTVVKNHLVTTGRSVGAIKARGRHLGTGFAIGRGLVLTNAHVLRGIANFNPVKRRWEVTPSATVTFDLEYPLGEAAGCQSANEARSYFVNGVVFAASDAASTVKNELIRDDIAVILTSVDDGFPKAIEISSPPAERFAKTIHIAVIGYPAKPADMTVLELKEHFSAPETEGPVAPYKRLASGYSGDRPAGLDGMFAHLANTAGGNSGSPVIDLTNGAVIGVHVRGEDRDTLAAKNWGISGTRVKAVLKEAGLER